MQVTLTFDNGPEPAVTPRVLDILEAAGVKATFFVLGSKLADNKRRALAKRAHADGHWIGNHTWSHAEPLGRIQDASRAVSEIIETEALINELAHPDRLFRPFGGGGELGPHLLSAAAVELLKKEKMTCVLWNAIPRDWEDPRGWVELAIAQCLAQPWTLLVLHDLPTGAMGRLKIFIERVRDHGGEFRQDFPPPCVPIVRGEVVGDVQAYVTR
ncbi:MAG TPA: polysaccharide deacetylase family protein [Burkholderiales bacterium]|nr:polysaccharide deacetylase family protein [Burkholderiales bacterium]